MSEHCQQGYHESCDEDGAKIRGTGGQKCGCECHAALTADERHWLRRFMLGQGA